MFQTDFVLEIHFFALSKNNSMHNLGCVFNKLWVLISLFCLLLGNCRLRVNSRVFSSI